MSHYTKLTNKNIRQLFGLIKKNFWNDSQNTVITINHYYNSCKKYNSILRRANIPNILQFFELSKKRICYKLEQSNTCRMVVREINLYKNHTPSNDYFININNNNDTYFLVYVISVSYDTKYKFVNGELHIRYYDNILRRYVDCVIQKGIKSGNYV